MCKAYMKSYTIKCPCDLSNLQSHSQFIKQGQSDGQYGYMTKA